MSDAIVIQKGLYSSTYWQHYTRYLKSKQKILTG